MFDAAAEITKAVRNKKWIKGKKLTAFTYLGICYFRLGEKNMSSFVRFTSERIIIY